MLAFFCARQELKQIEKKSMIASFCFIVRSKKRFAWFSSPPLVEIIAGSSRNESSVPCTAFSDESSVQLLPSTALGLWPRCESSINHTLSTLVYSSLVTSQQHLPRRISSSFHRSDQRHSQDDCTYTWSSELSVFTNIYAMDEVMFLSLKSRGL